MAQNTPPYLDENKHHVKKLWHLYEGETFFVLGTGTSLARFDWTRLNGRATIALNDAVKVKGFVPLFHIFSDVGIWKRYKDLTLSERTTVVCQRNARKNFITYGKCQFKTQVWQFNQTGHAVVERDNDDLFVSRTVATGGVQLAWKLGARRIFLLGVDGYRRDAAYYHDGTTKGKERRKEHREKDGRIVQDRHEAWASNMRELRKFFTQSKIYLGKYPGCGVYNCSRDSTIDAWEKVDIEEVLSA